ncbi:FAD-dependent oxidoreductase [Desulfosoma caldarium]|uniref:NADPH-dependent glutamate synthase beta subunit-like oxidoreductase n=1 Tax=Desulfosoma caldarium TaxID=610254 RepID=A0A3N1VRZ9_9BACT|nr:FAD-dependent oxidoreductase [Desulfosoma caldarium]ROR03012.1 NADPH-dependent glutamate synthase beta subunit-like oxidoreductase [Desulfosoma caldarium]
MEHPSISSTSVPFIPRSNTTTESNKTGSWRFLQPRYDEKTAPCSAACPAGEDIARVQMLVAQGLFKEAWETILQENPLPGVCGRVCFHPCETRCNRGPFDEPIAIHTVERFVADTALRYGLHPELGNSKSVQKEKVAVVGAGPSGLAAAYFLARLGYTCDVFEARSEPGGLLRWGIPPYRLPVSVVDREVDGIRSLGVRFHCGQRLSQDFLKALPKRYAAVFLGCGHYGNISAGIPGEDLPGVEQGLPFLESVRSGSVPSLEGTVAVIGGGNTAVDVSRCAVRLGARPIMVYRRRRQDMPAFGHEVDMALEEGVELMELWAPREISPHPQGLLLTLEQMEVVSEEEGRAVVRPLRGRTTTIVAAKIFMALGNTAEEPWLNPPTKDTSEVLRLANTVLVCHADGTAVAYGGDLAAQNKSVAHAIGSGKEAAIALDVFLRNGRNAVADRLARCRVGPGPSVSMEMYLEGERCRRNPHVVTFEEINTDYFLYSPRLVQPRLLKEERLQGFGEIDLKVSAALAIREAERCFNCGLCNQCDNCRLYCPDLAVCKDTSAQGRHINLDYCKGCGVCVVECPRNAMSLVENETGGRP